MKHVDAHPILVIAALVAVLSLGCAHKVTQSEQQTRSSIAKRGCGHRVEVRLDPLPSPATEPVAGDFVTLRRGACFGSCPMYSVTLWGDGRVVAVGENYVAHEGPQSWSIEPALARRVLLEFLRVDAFTEPLPIPGISDLPTAWLVVSVGDRHYSVEHPGGGSEFDPNPHRPPGPEMRLVEGSVRVQQQTSLQFESSVSKSQTFKAGDFLLDSGKAVSGSVRAEVERRVELKPGTQVADAARGLLTGPAVMTIGLEAKKGGSFGESGAELEFKVEGETGALLRAAWALQHGDPMGAADTIDKAEVTTKRTATSGLSLSLGVEAAGDGGSVGMKAMRKRQLSKETVEGTGRDMALRLIKSLGGNQGPSAPSPVRVNTVWQAKLPQLATS